MAHYFSRFPYPFNRRNSGSTSTMPGFWPHVEQPNPHENEENMIPYIPEGCEPEENKPVIPHNLLPLRAYRWRKSKNAWKHLSLGGLGEEELNGPCSTLRILTWNIDFASEGQKERLVAALRHLEEEVLGCKSREEAPEACVIMLQEVHEMVMKELLSDEWVRRWFVVTPISKDKWGEGSPYGNVTLICRTVNIVHCEILHFGISTQGRTGLCVKVKLNHPGSSETSVISLVNTHLESLAEGSIARPQQLEMCARFLKVQGVSGGVVCGDMNAISEEDEPLPKDVGLKDAWRRGETESGHTWGYQGNPGFPNRRLDKILFLPRMPYKVDEPRRFGIGVKTESGLFVSDHYGLQSALHMLKPRANSQ